MAWFRKDNGPDAVTLDCVRQMLVGWDLPVEVFRSDDGAPEMLLAVVGGVATTSMVTGPWLQITAEVFDLPIPPEREFEMVSWLNDYMADTTFGAGVVVHDEEDRTHSLEFSVHLPVHAGLYDDQLEEYVGASLNCVVDGVERFCEHFGIPLSVEE